jgi:LmbE family N-acetylglucosaminyl deacetylase
VDVLAFFAHPDDETILAGGALALLAHAGAQVHYLCATRGEGGEAGEPPLCELSELGAVREGEMVCAVQALGGRSLTFLDYIDPRVGADNQLFAYTDDLPFLAGQVAASIRQFQAKAVLTHGANGEYGHPAHMLSHQAARLAVQSFWQQPGDLRPVMYSVSAMHAHHPRPRLANKDESAHLVLDVTPALPAKTQAALCHRTQHALFVRRASQEAGRKLSVPEVILRVESLHRAFPEVSQASLPEDELFKLLLPWELAVQDNLAG